MTLAAGRRLGHYDIVSPLGAGGMGEVYRARDARLGRDVALKVLPEALALDADSLARFEREARAIAALNHPHIVTIYTTEEAEDVRFLTMELVEGQTLDRLIRAHGMSLSQFFDIATSLADAINAAHQKQITHRDLKPSNVMVTMDARVKVLDFGLARTIDPIDVTANEATKQTLTRAGTIMGTVPYMSPEQIEARVIDHRSDIFSLGIVYYEMATGVRPFVGDSSPSLMSSILKDQPRPVRELRPDAPEGVSHLVARCLEKQPRDRIQTAHEVLVELRALRRAWESGASGAPAVAPQPTGGASVAVMPFADLSPLKDQHYFCEGMADEIITALGGLSGLRVASRISTVRCQEKGLDAAEIGVRLNVRHIVEGTVRQAGKHLRITAQLSSTTDGYQLWSARYDRELDDVFAVQDEIAKTVADRLRVDLVSADEMLVRQGTKNPDAYALYLQGRYHWGRRNRARLRMAVESFQQALAKDPGYALAYAGLADCFGTMCLYGARPGVELTPLAITAAEHALQLGPQLAEAHHAYGGVQMHCKLNVAQAIRSLTRALELNPQLAISYAYLALAHAIQGRFDQAEQSARRAVEIEPDSSIIHFIAGGASLWARRLDLSDELETRSLELDPDSSFALTMLGHAHSARGRHAEALVYMERGSAISERQPLPLAGLGQVRARAGDLVGAESILQELIARQAHEYVSPIYMGDVLMGMARFDEACEWYERAADEGVGFLLRASSAMEFDAIRSYPRFQALLLRLGLTDVSSR